MVDFDWLLSILPKYIAAPLLFIFSILGILNLYGKFAFKLEIKRNTLSKRQFFIFPLCFLILFMIAIAYPLFHFYNQEVELKKTRSQLNQINQRLREYTLGAKRELSEEEPFLPPVTKDDFCKDWDYCTDFRTDLGLDNRYYRHTNEDPQKLILEGGPFANPPLYFEKEVSSFYKFQLDIQPLNEDAGNIFIESKDMFQLFIGDNDYRSLAFLHWDRKENKWVRGENAKIYLERDLKVLDIEPKTQLNLAVETRKKGNEATIEFTITYKSIKSEKETDRKEIARFNRTVDLPAAEPEKFLTKVGTGMYRVRGNIPQAKFYFMGIKEK